MNHQRSQIHAKKLSSLVKIIASGIAIIVAFLFWISWTGDLPVRVEKTIKIPSGMTTSQLDSLVLNDVNHTRYRLWYTLFGPAIELKSGLFIVPAGTQTLSDIFVVLQNPVPGEEELTLLPGWHKAEIATAFQKKEIQGDLLLDESMLINRLKSKYPFLEGKTTLEGFLMPDTYRIVSGGTIDQIVDKMLANFQKKIYTPYLATGKPLDALYDVLTLASIVQEEENSSTQVPIVADILKKRLRQGWQIGADVTLCYEKLLPGSECQKFINQYYSLSIGERKNLGYTYDTREKMGLPPTPIASVSASTFFATLDATAETEAWYYLHDNKGVIHTATTNAEHEQNKATYLR